MNIQGESIMRKKFVNLPENDYLCNCILALVVTFNTNSCQQMKMPSLSIRNFFQLFLLLMVAFSVLLLYSSSTSPLYETMRPFDPAIFECIGKGWAHGHIPYVEMWDSKGPVIFFANMLGYLLCDSRTGIFIIQVICLGITTWMSHRFLSSRISPTATFFCTAVMLLSFATICSQGNQVCEYTLPLSAWSVFCAFKWSEGFVKRRKVEHPVGYSVVYGLFFASSLLSRLSNAMGLSITIMIIIAVLIRYRRWSNLLRNALGFVCGFSLVFVPFAVYFGIHGAFSEMWYATFTYNLEYALISNPRETIPDVSHLIYCLFYYICLIALLVSSSLAFFQESRLLKLGLLWMPVPVLVLVWLFNSYANANYAIVYLPYLCVAFVLLYQMRDRTAKWLATGFLCLIVLGFANYNRIFRDWLYPEENEFANIMEGISEDDKQSFVAYMAEPYFYLVHDITPCYPYFVCQDWAILNGKSLRDRVRTSFESGKAKWVLVNYKTTNNVAVQDILNRLYVVEREDKKQELILYRRKGT